MLCTYDESFHARYIYILFRIIIIKYVNCLHIILLFNSIVLDTIKCIADSTGLLRELIRKIEGSPSMLAKLATACQLSEIPMSEPILDVSTRWYSTYEMIKRAIKLRRVSIY